MREVRSGKSVKQKCKFMTVGDNNSDAFFDYQGDSTDVPKKKNQEDSTEL